jgi:phosphopantetheinyl transferase
MVIYRNLLIIQSLMNITTHCYHASPLPEPILSFFSGMIPLGDLQIHIKNERHRYTALINLEKLDNAMQPADAKIPDLLLTKAEQAYFKRFRYQKRKLEWLGGRVAAKAAILEFTARGSLLNKMQQLTILPDEHGRPTADLPVNIALSISHSSKFAVALVSSRKTSGIDLQKISPKLPDLTDRFATAKDLSILAGLPVTADHVTRLTMLWAAKEALKKSILHDQPAIFSGIELRQATVVRDHTYCFSCTVHGQPDQTVMVHDFFPYILALTETNRYA